jgi:hypothetical protein
MHHQRQVNISARLVLDFFSSSNHNNMPEQTVSIPPLHCTALAYTPPEFILLFLGVFQLAFDGGKEMVLWC